MSYTLKVVSSAQDERAFIDLPKRLYKSTPQWVCPFDDDIRSVFDSARNDSFNDGEARRWLAFDEKGVCVGRIAAFFNRRTAMLDNEQPTGGCGFFEAIDDRELAFMLFDAAREWLAENGMEAMDGPINFGSRDQWWGLLVNGFEHQPLYANPYNPPYYQKMFEEYGFQTYFNQHTYARGISAGTLSEAVYARVKRLEEQPEYRFEHIRMEDLERVIEGFRTVYNKAWSMFTGVQQMDEAHARGLMNTLRPILDPELVYFAYYNDEPIGFFIMIPDLNRIIGKFNGKFGIINKLRFIWDLKVAKKVDRAFGLIFGVTPEQQGKGVESGMIRAFEKKVEEGTLPYKTLELAWIGDFNPVMMRMVEKFVCANRHKQHVTYRYLFDRTKEFKRCPSLALTRRERPAAAAPATDTATTTEK